MIAQLVRREPLWIVGIGMVLATLWGGFMPPGMRGTAAFGLLPALLLGAGNHRRATLFDAALPIPGRTLFTARLLFLLAAIWLPVCAAAGTLLAKGQADGAAVFCGSGMVVTAAAVFGITARIEEFDSSIPRAVFFAVAAMAIMIPELWQGYTAIVLVAAGSIAAGRLAMVWPRIPAGFQAAAVEPRRVRVERQGRPSSGLSLGVLPLVRASIPRPVIVMLAIVAFQGLLGSWTYGAVAGFGIPSMARRASRWLWGLPVSRRTLLAITVVPYLVCIAGSFAIGAWLPLFRRGAETPVVMYDEHTRAVECWRFARGNTAPVVQAPWGETVQPSATRLFGWVAYNPFVVAPRSSKPFVEWQFQRATAAIYGRPLSSAEYRVERENLRPLSLRWPAVAMNVAIILVVGMFGIFCFTVLESRVYARLSKIGRWVLGTAAVLLAFGPVLSVDFGGLFSGLNLTSNALASVLALRLSAYPWLGGAIVAAGYAMLQWQFGGVEAGRQIDTIGTRLIDQHSIQ